MENHVGGYPWGDGTVWTFQVSSQMYAGAPAADGSRRTHGMIQIDGTEFSMPLVGRGYVFDKTWRRLLTFDPQKFLPGSTATTIVIDLPTTHLLQHTSETQPAGPVVEQKLDPQQGSLFTRVDIQTPDDQTYNCNYIRLPENQPACATVNPAVAVELPR